MKLVNKEIIIRKVRNEDAIQYIDLHNLVWRYAYKNIFPEEVFLEKESRRLDKIKKFPEVHFNDNTTLCYVAEVDNEIIGFIYGKIKSDYQHFKDLNYADLVGLYIHPDYQRKGIANKFRQIFVEWLKKIKLMNMLLEF